MDRVMVTGSNRGIGLALVQEAITRGDRVFAGCRSPQNADALRALRESHRAELSIIHLDLLDPKTHEAARKEVETQAGGLDVLINNAGIYVAHPTVRPERSHRSIEHFDAASTLEFFRVNTVAPLALTRVLVPLLTHGGGSRVGFLSSGMGSIARKNDADIEYGYSGSKAALNMLCRVLAHELAGHQILTVAIDPGWVRTDMGTDRAPLDPNDVARSIWNVLDALDASGSGDFVDRRGNRVPW